MDALGKEKPLREVVKPYPERPAQAPLPKPQPLIAYGEPEGAAVSERAPYKEPHPTPAVTPPVEYAEPKGANP